MAKLDSNNPSPTPELSMEKIDYIRETLNKLSIEEKSRQEITSIQDTLLLLSINCKRKIH